MVIMKLKISQRRRIRKVNQSRNQPKRMRKRMVTRKRMVKNRK